jgi:hypothetical protein
MIAADDVSRPVLTAAAPLANRRRPSAVAAFVLGLLAPSLGLLVAVAALLFAASAWRGDGLSKLLSVLGAVLACSVLFVFSLPALFAAFP